MGTNIDTIQGEYHMEAAALALLADSKTESSARSICQLLWAGGDPLGPNSFDQSTNIKIVRLLLFNSASHTRWQILI